MKLKALMCGVLCTAIALGSMVPAFAEDDFGIESASPIAIADPINPQPGMIFNAYDYDRWFDGDQLKESNSKLPVLPAAKTGVDKGEKFGKDIANEVSFKAIRWEGFLKCKRVGTYTFLFQKKQRWEFENGYSVRINGLPVIPAAYGQATCDVNLKVGWNKVEIVCQFASDEPLNISFKPKGYLSEPRSLSPKDFFHDEKPEVPDWF